MLYFYLHHWCRYKYGNSWRFCENPGRNQVAADDQWAPLCESTRVPGSRACSNSIRYEMIIENSRFSVTTYQSPNSFYKTYGFQRRSAIPLLNTFSFPYHATNHLLRFELLGDQYQVEHKNGCMNQSSQQENNLGSVVIPVPVPGDRIARAG